MVWSQPTIEISQIFYNILGLWVKHLYELLYVEMAIKDLSSLLIFILNSEHVHESLYFEAQAC